jgi:hypothetical protein
MLSRKRHNKRKKTDTLKKLNKDHMRCREESTENEKINLLDKLKEKDFDDTVINFFFCKCNNENFKSKSVMVEIDLPDITKIDYKVDDMTHLSDLRDFSNETNRLLNEQDVSIKNIHEYIIQLFFLNRNIYIQLVEKQGKGQDMDAYNCKKGLVLKKELIIEPELVSVNEPEIETASMPEPEGETASMPEPEGETASIPGPEGETASMPEPEGETASIPVNEPEINNELESAPMPVPESRDDDYMFNDVEEIPVSLNKEREIDNELSEDNSTISLSENNDLRIEDVEDDFGEAESENSEEKTNVQPTNKLPVDVEAFAIIDKLKNDVEIAISLIDNAAKNIEKAPSRPQINIINTTINKEINDILSKPKLKEFASNTFIQDLLSDAHEDVTAEEIAFIMEKIICNIGKVDLNLSNKVLKDFKIVLDKFDEEPELLELAVENYVGRTTDLSEDDLRRPENFPDCIPDKGTGGSNKKIQKKTKKHNKKQRKNKTKRGKK